MYIKLIESCVVISDSRKIVNIVNMDKVTSLIQSSSENSVVLGHN